VVGHIYLTVPQLVSQVEALLESKSQIEGLAAFEWMATRRNSEQTINYERLAFSYTNVAVNVD